jgi:protein-tyrosine phosphatase
MNIKTIIRLNKPKYDKNIFLKAGFRHHDLYFPDCTIPSNDIIDSFNKIIENEDNSVAVHCKAGLGRTGTLIALYLMKHYHICARDVIAWLKLLRPGSIIGAQQNFLISQQNNSFNKNSEIFSNLEQEKKLIADFFLNSLKKTKSPKILNNVLKKSVKLKEYSLKKIKDK